MKKKLCVLLPGVGYTTDKPLMYYSGKMLKNEGYDCIFIQYANLPTNIKDDKDKKENAFLIALEQTKNQLSEVNWNEYESIVFVGKSIGTIIAAAYGCDMPEVEAEVKYIYLTPLQQTFDYAKNSSGIAFHGTSDPWVETETVEKECKDKNIPLFKYENANHSLETGNVPVDIEYLSDVMEKIREYLF